MFSRTASRSSSSSATSIRNDRVSAQAQLNSPLLSPTVSLSSLPEAPPTPTTKQKQKRPVHASSRGGLGNIRARKQSQANIAKDTTSANAISSPTSPSTKSSSSAGSTSPSSFRFRRVLSVGSNSTHSTVSSGSSVYSNVDSVAATFGSGAASVISGMSGSGASASGVGGDEYDVSEPGSPLSPSFASGKEKGKAKTVVSTSAEYALHLQTDARHRALEKQLVKARAKEMEVGNALDGEPSTEEKVVKVRSSRGGAGMYKAKEFGVDPALHPHAATITQEYEARAAAHTREIIAASRMRSALEGSTGRGGAGNVGAGGKRVKSQVKKSKKGKEKAQEDALGEDTNDRSLDISSALDEHGDDDATVVHEDGAPDGEERKDRKKSPRFRKLFRRAVRANGNQIEVNPIPPPSDDSTPRPSMGDSVLEIGRPSSPSPSFPSVASSATLSSPQPTPSSSSSFYGMQGTARLRRQQWSRDELKEGAELLAFVNAALPDLPGARNVLGVPGTPGFPLPGGMSAPSPAAAAAIQRSYTTPSSRSSKPVNNHAGTNSNDFGSHGRINAVHSIPLIAAESSSNAEEEWVDDDTLHEGDEDEENYSEEEDSDIDPQMLPRATRKEQQFALPKYDYNKHDSLDLVIRVALDKLDRSEIRDKEDSDEGGIDLYASSNRTNRYDGSGPQAPCSPPAHQASRRVPPVSSPSLAPEPLILPYNVGSRAARYPMQKVIGGETAAGGKHRFAVPLASPPPTRPVPRLPDQF